MCKEIKEKYNLKISILIDKYDKRKFSPYWIDHIDLAYNPGYSEVPAKNVFKNKLQEIIKANINKLVKTSLVQEWIQIDNEYYKISVQTFPSIASSKYDSHTFYISTSFPDENIALSKKYTYCTKAKPHYHYLELLCRSLGGQTIGYKKANNKVIPVKEIVSDDIILNWGFESYLQGIKDFTKEILYLEKSINDVNLCYLYHDYLTTKCDYNTAVILGDIPFLTIGDEKNIKKAAPELPLWKIILLLIKGRKIDELSEFPHITLLKMQFI